MADSYNPTSLVGKKVLVTGASSGIGRATAIYASRLGAQVILTARNDQRLQQTLDAMAGEGHAYYSFDLAGEDDFKPLFDKVISDGIKLDGLVHCAGIPYVMPLASLTKARLHEVMNTNFYSFVELCRYYAKKKYSNGGSIVAMSAAMLRKPRAYELGYMASKASIEIAVKTLAWELSNRGIRVNAVMPGNVRTEMIERTLQEADNAQRVQEIVDSSICGWESPEDIAASTAFLLSDMSRVITGRILEADGGTI